MAEGELMRVKEAMAERRIENVHIYGGDGSDGGYIIF